MLAVFLLFALPIGGGIPAGVLLAQARGFPWPLTAGLYLLSDVLLALVLEPILQFLVRLGRRVPFLARLGSAVQAAMVQSASTFGGQGPLTLIAVAFGVDPMTGRAAALAAGYGGVAGWAFAIAGDMLYYGVVALATLRLNAFIGNPSHTVLLVFGLMLLVPMLVRRLRARTSLPASPESCP